MFIRTGALAAALVWAGAGLAQPPVQGGAQKEESTPDHAPPPAGTPTEEELHALEESLAADAARAPDRPAPGPSLPAAIQSLNPDIALILDVSGAAFAGPPQAAAEEHGHDPTAPGFNLQALEMYLASAVDPYFRLDGTLVFDLEGVEVEEAYGTTLALPLGLQLRAGQFLTRFGRLNPTHPHAWSFVDRPLVMSKFLGADGSRGVGLETSWLTPLPWYAELVASATMPGGDCCGRSFLPEDEEPAIGDAVGTLALKEFFPFGEDLSLLWGLSGQVGRNAADRLTTIAGTDLYLRWRPVASADREAISLQAEVLYRSRATEPERLTDWGGYAQAVWKVGPRWEGGARAEYVSGVPGDPLDPYWTSGRTRYAVQASFFPSHFSRVRLQLAIDDAAWEDDPRFAAFLALELAAGAHGAHSY